MSRGALIGIALGAGAILVWIFSKSHTAISNSTTLPVARQAVNGQGINVPGVAPPVPGGIQTPIPGKSIGTVAPIKSIYGALEPPVVSPAQNPSYTSIYGSLMPPLVTLPPGVDLPSTVFVDPTTIDQAAPFVPDDPGIVPYITPLGGGNL
jgi:hypothetical protein